MLQVLTLQWPCLVSWKPGGEDVSALDAGRKVFVVCDGVTRRGFAGPYPNPSPAYRAAHAASSQLCETLVAYCGQMTERRIRQAFADANAQVRSVNERLGLWDNSDWWGRDLAGTVAACVVLEDDYFWYGFIADCGVSQLSTAGELLWHTPNELAPVEPYFPTIAEVGIRERYIRVRRDYRNRPDAEYPTYGVLTGETAALFYVSVGRRPYRRGDIFAVYSDGAAPFVVDDPVFQYLLSHGTQTEIVDYVTRHSSPEHNSDEKTLILIHTQLG